MAEPPPALSTVVASYLHEHGLSKTLDAFLAECHCKFSEEQVVVDLENIYNHYILTQTSEIPERKMKKKKKKKKTEKEIHEVDQSEKQVKANGVMPVPKSSQDKCKIRDNAEMVMKENTETKKKQRMEIVPVVEPGLKIEVIGIPRQVVLGDEGRKLAKNIEYTSENKRKNKRKKNVEAELMKEHKVQFEVVEVQDALASQKGEVCVKHEEHANEEMLVKKDRQRKKRKKSEAETAAYPHKKVQNCEFQVVAHPQEAVGYTDYKDEPYSMKIKSLKQDLADKGRLSKKWISNEPLAEHLDNVLQNHLHQTRTGLIADQKNKVGSGKIQAVTETQKHVGYTDYKEEKHGIKNKSVKKEKMHVPETTITQYERHCKGKENIEGMPEQYFDLMQYQSKRPGTDLDVEHQRKIINGEIETVADPQEQLGYADNKEGITHDMKVRSVHGEVHNSEWIPTHNERKKKKNKKIEGMLEKHDGVTQHQSNELHWQKENLKRGMGATLLENGGTAKKEHQNRDIDSELNERQKIEANPAGYSVSIHSSMNGSECVKEVVEKKSVAATDGPAVESSFDMQKNEKNKLISENRNPCGSLAFKRVDISKVEFADPRLQDNSYWSKDGAQEGWGAKAQSVLGLVRGKDFRHEKTKKKRGSYRGGSIDFNSHSVKFSYSDDE